MSESLITSLFSMLDSRTVDGIAGSLGASGQSVTQGLKSAIAAVLGGMVTKSDNPTALRSLLDMAPSSAGTLTEVAGAASDPNSPLISAGKNILSSLFGDRESSVTSAVGAQSGLPSGTASTLLTLAAPMVMSFLNRRVHLEGLSMNGLGSLLQSESGRIRNALPASLADLFSPPRVTSPVPAMAQVGASESSSHWLPLLGVALLCLGLFWLLNEVRRPAARAVGTASRAINDVADSVNRSLMENADLKFDTGSAKIRPESRAMLDNIAATLQKYPDTRVKITGYTDSSGNAAQNLRLSQERAKAVQVALVERGISPTRLIAEGRGEEHPADASAAAQARDRRVYLKVIQP